VSNNLLALILATSVCLALLTLMKRVNLRRVIRAIPLSEKETWCDDCDGNDADYSHAQAKANRVAIVTETAKHSDGGRHYR
jgi:hypothetical protein